MSSELLLVLAGLALILVLGATVFSAVRMSRLGASVPADLEARLSDLEGGVTRIESEIGRSVAAIREDVDRARDDDREVLKAFRVDVTASVGMLAEGLRNSIGDLAMVQKERLASFEALLGQVKSNAASDNLHLREEVRSTLAQFGDAVTRAITQLSSIQRERLDALMGEMGRLASGSEQRQETLRRAIEAMLGESRADATTNARSLAEDVSGRLKLLADGMTQSIQHISEAQRERLDGLSRSIAALSQSVDSKQEALRQAVDNRLASIQTEHSDQLAQVRLAIDGELQSARDLRLFDSVKRVSESLDQVHKAVGEMQSIAAGTGNLRALPRSFDSPR